ncbi:MAG: DegT/DnrJ/EryC1/StrS family aminotransferase, partial [Bacillota bacterium]
GGLVAMRDPELAKRAALYADKYYHRAGSGRDPAWLAPNYRMTELQGAVGLAQLKKLPWICERRHALGERLTGGLSGLPGVYPHRITEGGWSSYWFYMLRIDEQELGVTRAEFVEALRAEGIPCTEGYITRPVYCYDVLAKRQILRNSGFPLDPVFHEGTPSYGPGLCPVAEEVLSTACRLPINEFYTDQDIEDMIEALRKVALYFSARGA